MSSPIYISTDGSGPGGQWSRTGRGWRLSESESDVEAQSPQRDHVENLLEKHLKKQSNDLIMIRAEGINGAPPSRAGPSENLNYLPLLTKTTRESGYTTLGEALRRLNFIEALDDPHKFNFIIQVVDLTVRERLLSLSGCAIRRLFGILSKMIDVIESRSEFGSREMISEIISVFEKKLKEFKKQLSCSHSAIQCCIDRCEHLQLRLKNLKLIKVKKPDENTNIQDLPIEVQDKIMLTLNNLKDFEALSQVTPMFAEIAEEYEHIHLDHMINHHWDDNQKRDWKLPVWKSNAPETESQNLSIDEMKAQFKRLSRKHGKRLDCPLVMKYCERSCVLYWEDSSHPYQEKFEMDRIRNIEPQHFITFFDKQ